MKVATIIGTRPEVIRLSATIRRLDCVVDHILIHTGQNYDFELNELLFRDLQLRTPDHYLNAGSNTLGKTLAQILEKTEAVLLEVRPDAVLILGDTNSALAAIIARRMHIPVYHMEAGNRCFDFNVPEELNRRIVDHIADFNLVYTEHARRHLLSEGLPHRSIYLTGSPMREVLNGSCDGIAASRICNELGVRPGEYCVVSVHREENVDLRDNFEKVMEILSGVRDTYGHEVLVSCHPRTRKRMVEFGRDEHSMPGVRFLKPFGFFDYLRLQRDAFITLSDSGTIAEESAILGFPAVTLRQAIERPEALDTGSIIITGLDASVVINAIALARAPFEHGRRPECPTDYMIDNTSERVVNLIVGTARLARRWIGLDDGWFTY